MKKLFSFCVIFILSNCTNIDQPLQKPLRLVELQGTAYNRGLIHGKTLKEEIKKRNFNIGYEDIKAILSSRKYNAGRPICHYNTYGCTIMILTDDPEPHITPGRPDKNEFLIYKFIN